LDGKADKVVCNFTASVASAYRLSTSKLTFLDLNKDYLVWSADGRIHAIGKLEVYCEVLKNYIGPFRAKDMEC
jgi:hypothetical protein